MSDLFLFGSVVVVVLGVVLIAALAWHGWSAYLALRERERLSATAKAELEQELSALKRQQNEFKNALANLPRR